MNRFYKKVSFIFVMAFAIMLGCFSNVLAVDIGQTISSAETGWQRIDNTDSNVTYDSDHRWNTYTELSFNMYNNTGKQSSEKYSCIRFNFYGSKIRIIGRYDTDKSNNIVVNIDNVDYSSFSQYGTPKSQVLNFEKTGLDKKEHTVKIINKANGYMFLDAVDIDSTGKLLPYNENPVSKTILNIEPEKNKIHLNEGVTANLTIDNIKEIAAEDVRIKYDSSKLQFLGIDEVEGIKLVKQPDSEPGELRFIIASKGEKNIVNAKKALLKLKFKGISAGEALVDVTKGRVSDGIEMEKDLTDEQCGQATIIIDENVLKDVNNSGGFTLLDLGIDARHMGKDPKSDELAKYNTDIVANNAIDDADLLEIGKLMLENPDYKF